MKIINVISFVKYKSIPKHIIYLQRSMKYTEWILIHNYDTNIDEEFYIKSRRKFLFNINTAGVCLAQTTQIPAELSSSYHTDFPSLDSELDANQYSIF
jgi:hypothetical protein